MSMPQASITTVSILPESYCNSSSSATRRIRASCFNSPRVLLQRADHPTAQALYFVFQFSQSLIATFLSRRASFVQLLFQFSQSLIATEYLIDGPRHRGVVSILPESYCNAEGLDVEPLNYTCFNSPRVLLQLGTRGHPPVVPGGTSFNSPRVLLQHCPCGSPA